MGHMSPRRTPDHHRPPPPPRLVPLHDEDDLLRMVKAEYVADRIDAEEMEAGIAHVLAGGRGCEEFPYLPVFSPGGLESVWR